MLENSREAAWPAPRRRRKLTLAPPGANRNAVYHRLARFHRSNEATGVLRQGYCFSDRPIERRHETLPRIRRILLLARLAPWRTASRGSSGWPRLRGGVNAYDVQYGSGSCSKSAAISSADR